MPGTTSVAPGEMAFHVLNRGVGRMALFRSDADYRAFESLVDATLDALPMRACSYCLLPNHWRYPEVVRYGERNALRASVVDRPDLYR